MWTNLMMAGTQSVMALIIPASTAESSRPPQRLWLCLQNLLTSIFALLCSPPPFSVSASLNTCHTCPLASSGTLHFYSFPPVPLSPSASIWHEMLVVRLYIVNECRHGAECGAGRERQVFKWLCHPAVRCGMLPRIWHKATSMNMQSSYDDV